MVPFVPTIESPTTVGRGRAIELLKPLLEDPGVEKVAADGKRLRVALAREGASLEGLRFDVRIAAYLVDPGGRSYDLGDLAADHLGTRRSARPGAEEAELALRLQPPLEEALSAEGLETVFRSMEMPLVDVMAAMETAGVKVDAALLASMSREMEARISGLSREIHDLAGEDFNINSPTQLREVLFGRLGLRSGKKTAKTRAASTAEDVLEDLALEHPLPRKILEYRSVQKLKSTYVDALPQLINPTTGRIHATFHQTVAATGRISSSDPNLQNIPIRTAEGRRIREAFVAEVGYRLLSADYSQIELRVLAHLSKDETLIAAFRRGEDIHDRTSREIFGPFSPLPPDEQRRRSKMVNYALLYGKTAFSLAKDIGISRKEADAFVEAYFARYPGVRRFMDATLASARETGTVRTLLGRLRRLPDLHAQSFQARSEAERQAMNTPVQGSAADLDQEGDGGPPSRAERARAPDAPHSADPRRAPSGNARRRGRRGIVPGDAGDGTGSPARRAPRRRGAPGEELGRRPLRGRDDPALTSPKAGPYSLASKWRPTLRAREEGMRIAVGLVTGVLLAAGGPLMAGSNHLVSPELAQERIAGASEARGADLARVESALSTPQAARTAASMGVDIRGVRSAATTLTDAELHDLAARSSALDVDPASGLTHDVDELLVIFLVVAIVILVIKAVD